jgi:hypothetical protein
MANVLVLRFPAAIGVQRSECVLEDLFQTWLAAQPRAEKRHDLYVSIEPDRMA